MKVLPKGYHSGKLPVERAVLKLIIFFSLFHFENCASCLTFFGKKWNLTSNLKYQRRKNYSKVSQTLYANGNPKIQCKNGVTFIVLVKCHWVRYACQYSSKTNTKCIGSFCIHTDTLLQHFCSRHTQFITITVEESYKNPWHRHVC